MGTRTDQALTQNEKRVLSVLAVAGLVTWAIAALFLAGQLGRTRSMGRTRSTSSYPSYPSWAAAHGRDVQPPLVYNGATATVQTLHRNVSTPTGTPLPVQTLQYNVSTPTGTPVPTGVDMLPIDGDIEVIAVLGIDEPHGTAIWRTDSIILAFVDRKMQRLSLLSIPRDLWLQIPGHAANRINTVDALGERTHHPGGGRGLLDETLRLNLGVPVHHHVRVDFQGFVDIVDTIGGVTVDVKKPLREKYPDRTEPSGWTWVELPAGPLHMDGQMALMYSRLRYATGDFDRAARQQQVLYALAQKALTVETLTRAPQLWKQLDSAVDTDLDIAQAVQLAYFAKELPADQIRSRQIDTSLIQYWVTADGAQVLLPRNEAIRQFILELVNGP